MRAGFIFNPNADKGQARAEMSALKILANEKDDTNWYVTERPGHAEELAVALSRQGYDRIIALGGDGTIHEVINGIMQNPEGQRPDLAVVPIGSGNDFCFSLGVSLKPEEALKEALTLPALPLDVGWMRDNAGKERYWMNVIGIGFDAVINAHSRTMPIFRGFLMYLLCALKAIAFNYTCFHLTGRRDGADWQGTYMMYVICNGKREGGGFLVAPNAQLGDGKFHSVAVTPISRPRMLLTLPYFLKGSQFDLSYVKDGQFKSSTFDSDVPLTLHLDGELYAGLDSTIRKLEVKILPGALRVVQKPAK